MFWQRLLPTSITKFQAQGLGQGCGKLSSSPPSHNWQMISEISPAECRSARTMSRSCWTGWLDKLSKNTISTEGLRVAVRNICWSASGKTYLRPRRILGRQSSLPQLISPKHSPPWLQPLPQDFRGQGSYAMTYQDHRVLLIRQADECESGQCPLRPSASDGGVPQWSLLGVNIDSFEAVSEDVYQCSTGTHTVVPDGVQEQADPDKPSEPDYCHYHLFLCLPPELYKYVDDNVIMEKLNMGNVPTDGRFVRTKWAMQTKISSWKLCTKLLHREWKSMPPRLKPSLSHNWKIMPWMLSLRTMKGARWGPRRAWRYSVCASFQTREWRPRMLTSGGSLLPGSWP